MKVLRLEENTWNLLSVFGTMVGISTDRTLVTRVERSLYICIFAVGFFCSSDVLTSLMNIYYPEQVELQILNFKDLSDILICRSQ